MGARHKNSWKPPTSIFTSGRKHFAAKEQVHPKNKLAQSASAPWLRID
jgi:hypothetical protein